VEAEFGNAARPSARQARAEGWVDPGPGHDARTVARDPLLLGEVAQLLDCLRGIQAAFVERRLNGIHAPLHRGGVLDDEIMIGFVHRCVWIIRSVA